MLESCLVVVALRTRSLPAQVAVTVSPPSWARIVGVAVFER